MVLWKESTGKETGAKESFLGSDPMPRESEKIYTASAMSPGASPPREASIPSRATAPVAMKESLLSSDLVIEGKIEGSGHVRIAGKFKGDIQVQGNVTIEQGAQVTGEIKADMVIVGGELNGNITAGSRVELLATGILNGDLNAGSLTVVAGSRMRGRVEFGWNDKTGK